MILVPLSPEESALHEFINRQLVTANETIKHLRQALSSVRAERDAALRDAPAVVPRPVPEPPLVARTVHAHASVLAGEGIAQAKADAANLRQQLETERLDRRAETELLRARLKNCQKRFAQDAAKERP
jgi:hypothetical protein